MSIANYTTSIKPEKSIMEIQKILSENGASAITVDYSDGKPVSVSFLIAVNGYYISFRLPSNHQGVLRAMNRDKTIPVRLKTNDQALQVSWRIVKDWIRAQMAIVQSGQVELCELMLPYAVSEDGQTLGKKMLSGDPKKLLSL